MSASVDPVFDLKFNLLRNINYNNRRRRFFSRASRMVQAFVIFGSCGAIALFMGDLSPWVASIASVIVAAVSSLDMAFDPRGRVFEYAGIEREYHILLERLESLRTRGTRTEPALFDLRDEYNSLHKGEPPLNVTVNLMAHNDTLYQLHGDNQKYCQENREILNWWQVLTANFTDPKAAETAAIR